MVRRLYAPSIRNPSNMNKEAPRFTVIIPSKDRADYLSATLRTCMMQNYDRLEIIVSDDHSTDETRTVVEAAAAHDSRIRYVTPPIGGMLRNFEYALEQVQDGYVIALGGDDGLLPKGISGMWELLRETGTELAAWPAPIFSYPGVRGDAGQLALYRGRGVRVIESEVYLKRQARTLNYLADVEAPMFYVKGVASVRLINRVRERTPGRMFYSCPTPDGYSGIVLAGEVSRYAYTSEPMSIFGLSPKSQGRAYLQEAKESKELSEKFFKDVSSRPMHRDLASQPYSPLITLMTVDYLLTARDLPGWSGPVPVIDYRTVLHRGLQELAHGLYGHTRVRRELEILDRIAEMHGLRAFFRDQVHATRRYKQRALFGGSGLNTDSLFFDARTLGISDVCDAAHAAYSLTKLYGQISFKGALSALWRSACYKFRALQRDRPFPIDTTGDDFA